MTAKAIVKNRIEEYDIIKCLAIIMIVVGHSGCPDYLRSLVYWIHVPLFFHISGCTNRKDEYYANSCNVFEFIKKRIKTLYLPFLKYAIPIILLHNVLYSWGWYDTNFTVAEYGKQLARTLVLSIGDKEPLLKHLWFIKTLFLAEILYAILLYVLQKLHVRKWYVILPLGVMAYVINISSLPHVFSSNLIWPLRALLLYSLPQFVGGGIWNVNKSTRAIAVIATLAVWLILPYSMKTTFQTAHGYEGLIQVFITMGMYQVLFLFSSYLLNIIEPKYIRPFLYIGRNTMPIYYLHYVAFMVLTYLAFLYYGNEVTVSDIRTGVIPWWAYTLFAIVSTLSFGYITTFVKNKLLRK